MLRQKREQAEPTNDEDDAAMIAALQQVETEHVRLREAQELARASEQDFLEAQRIRYLQQKALAEEEARYALADEDVERMLADAEREQLSFVSAIFLIFLTLHKGAGR
jgi:mevalonate pyrophosphate decarboxylase